MLHPKPSTSRCESLCRCVLLLLTDSARRSGVKARLEQDSQQGKGNLPTTRAPLLYVLVP